MQKKLYFSVLNVDTSHGAAIVGSFDRNTAIAAMAELVEKEGMENTVTWFEMSFDSANVYAEVKECFKDTEIFTLLLTR